ncbi:RyR domain-containing protein [Candidatus Amarolinea dominans]|uniref:RyR domain-containing protein n=1 Tax=Candidatus Amarolinea dominans TaxID=3140696 RepID=UPI0031349EED|nr:hypothetical protein [Anaerolineae bacterium]
MNHATESEATTLAQIEHAHWVVKHMQCGWTAGERRDPIQKASPYLVPWGELPPMVQEEREKERRYTPRRSPVWALLHRIP